MSTGTATAADVLKGRPREDRKGNIAALVDAGFDHQDAFRESSLYARGASRKTFNPQPLALDLDAVPDPPDWLVHGVIERGTVAMFAGDTGAAKSLTTASLIVAALQGSDWLGHRTEIGRVLVIDEENPKGLVLGRLRALGLTNDEAERLRYFNREGFDIGSPETDGRLAALLEDFKPDLVVVDTLMSATATADINSNSDAVRMMKQLRALAQTSACAVLILHHERKATMDGAHSAGSSQQTMGARQWIGQADALITIARESDMASEPTDSGGVKLRRTFKFRPAEKDRDGRPSQHRRLAVESEKDDAGRLLWMTVTDEGAISSDSAAESAEKAILAALVDSEAESSSRAEIAAAVGERDPSDPSGTFKRELKELGIRGLVESAARGRYAITAEGRKVAGLTI